MSIEKTAATWRRSLTAGQPTIWWIRARRSERFCLRSRCVPTPIFLTHLHPFPLQPILTELFRGDPTQPAGGTNRYATQTQGAQRLPVVRIVVHEQGASRLQCAPLTSQSTARVRYPPLIVSNITHPYREVLVAGGGLARSKRTRERERSTNVRVTPHCRVLHPRWD